MSKDVSTREPSSFIAGATVPWSKCLPDYPASQGWALTYALRGPDATGIDVEAVADGDDYLVTISSDDSDVTPGTYRMIAWVERDDEKYYVVDQQVVILAAPADGVYETRTPEEITLESLTTAIANSAGNDIVRYQVGDLMVERSRTEAIAAHKYFSGIVRDQQRQRSGRPVFDTINTSFR